MEKRETIRNETLMGREEEETVREIGLTEETMHEVYESRKSALGGIQEMISLKFYHRISEKLENEKRQFEKLLHIEGVKQDVLANYSFVLNSYYFEQKFL